jgi:glycosyltransferase involved in cell wall biosynthesis
VKIGFDAKRAFCNNTGLGNYSRLLVDVLSEYYPQNEYFLYTPKIRDNVRLDPILKKRNISIATPRSAFGRAFSSFWRVSGITGDIRHDRISLFHGLSSELPLTITSGIDIPSVVTVHDLIFLIHPECYSYFDRKIYNYKFWRSCENASRIIAISNCTKRDIVNTYGVMSEKIEVVYQACDESFKRRCSKEEIESVRSKYGLPQHFIINVATVELRKNALLAVKAMENVDSRLHLVIVGHHTAYADQLKDYIAKHQLSGRVHFQQNVAFSELPALYQMAEVSVYPSRYEGFGLPVLESISCGTPVVAATGSCLEEAGGDGALYVNPDDVDGMAKAINSIANDADCRKELIENGQIYTMNFSRQSMAHETMTVYRKVLGTL